MAEHLIVTREGPVARVQLNRPDVRNAFNDVLIAELIETFEAVGQDEGVRCVVLSGAGKAFCAGADLQWMKSLVTATAEDNTASAKRMAGLFSVIDRCPVPVVGKIHGAAIGGGVGLVACLDVPIAEAGTVFAFSEVRLGLAPAVISPFVIRKIGVARARELFVTGSRFSAHRACEIGLLAYSEDGDEAVDARVARVVSSIIKGGPQALRACKALAMDVMDLTGDERHEFTSRLIAERRASAEGQEGIRAFFMRDTPAWLKTTS